MLIGRESECAQLDELLARAMEGRAGVLVLHGDAGIGKTALLDYAIGQAAGMAVVRALGVESEAELEFSGLLEVCRPLLDRLAELPQQQADALRGALGLGPAEPHDRFAVGVATLGLLAAESEATPLLVVVDDAHWLDRSSQESLLFAARRLAADRTCVLFAARSGEQRAFEASGLPRLELAGLSQQAAGALVAAGGRAVRAEVAEQLWRATAGNPLALLELPSLLTAEQLAGDAPLSQPVPGGTSSERAFARRVERLPVDSRRALLVAAVSTSSAAAVILSALSSLGVEAKALEPAEDSGLIRLVEDRWEFRHPLVRSAAYHAAAPSERREAHRAVADALSGSSHADARAWHLASAAVGRDEEAARALEQAAEHAWRRSGYAGAAAALERAARLTPDANVAVRRLSAAADAAWRAGRTEAASALVAEALAQGDDPGVRAETLRLHGAIEYFAGRGETAAAAFTEAVTPLGETNVDAAVAAAADAVNALIRVRQPERALEAARNARALAPTDSGEADLEATIALGYSLCYCGRYVEAEPQLQRAADLFGESTTLAAPLQAGRLSAALGWLCRHGEAHAYLAENVSRARDTGAVASLPYLLSGSAWQALHASRWNEAYADASEALELAEEIGQPVNTVLALGILTWLHALRGDEAACREHAQETDRRASAFGFTLYRRLASLCLRAGRTTEAETLLVAFDSSDLASVPLFAAHAERCRGLLGDGDALEAHFVEALALHAGAESPFALARTRLAYGERLRRAGRRVEARQQLRSALETFERIGAGPWAARTRSELRASGETLRRRDPAEHEQLTPQELQIALQVAEGRTNKEVAAALFLSPRTVEYHLRHVFRKVGVDSRAELIRRLAGEPVVAVAP